MIVDEDYVIIGTPEHFRLYKEGLDWKGCAHHRPYPFKHYGEPVEYPAAVSSEFWDDPNGPWSYEHSFVYIGDLELLLAPLLQVRRELEARSVTEGRG